MGLGCVICHELLEDCPVEDASSDCDAKSNIVALKCGHCFHGLCIKSWLKQKSNCPVCREKCLKRDLKDIFPSVVEDNNTQAAGGLEYTAGGIDNVELPDSNGQKPITKPTFFGRFMSFWNNNNSSDVIGPNITFDELKDMYLKLKADHSSLTEKYNNLIPVVEENNYLHGQLNTSNGNSNENATNSTEDDEEPADKRRRIDPNEQIQEINDVDDADDVDDENDPEPLEPADLAGLDLLDLI